MNRKTKFVKSKNLIPVIIGMVSFLLVSCNATRMRYPYTLNEKYKTVNLSDRKILVVFPGDENIIINNKDDVADDFGGVNAKPESRIRKYYFPEFFSTFKSFVSGDSIFVFDQFRSDITWDTLSRNEVTLRNGSDSIGVPYLIPEKSRMQALGLDSTVFVVIEMIEFKRNKFQIEYYWDDRSRKPANLEVVAKVLIWDYKNNEQVFYGTVSEQTEFHFGLQRKHWDESAHDLAKKIVLAAKCL